MHETRNDFLDRLFGLKGKTAVVVGGTKKEDEMQGQGEAS